MASEQGFVAARKRARSSAITIRDVAALAGVSIGTVSRVLNDHDWVSADSRAKVTEAIRKTGYVPNSRARAFVTGRTNSVALVLGASPSALLQDPNYALILEEAGNALAAANFTLVLLTASTAQDRERVATYLRGQHVDGVIFLSPAEKGHDPLLDLLESRALPVVVVGNPFAEIRRLSFVQADDVTGSEALGRHFRVKNYRHTAVVAAYPDTLGPQVRIDAFQRGLGRVVDVVCPATDYSLDAGRAATIELLDSSHAIDSVFATSDALAAGAIQAIELRGLRVPDDVAVAGFDDSPLASQVIPHLTTVRQPVADVARALVEEVLRGVDGEETRSRTLDTELVIRDSA